MGPIATLGYAESPKVSIAFCLDKGSWTIVGPVIFGWTAVRIYFLMSSGNKTPANASFVKMNFISIEKKDFD